MPPGLWLSAAAGPVACWVYGVAADVTEALASLASETKAKGWWHAYGDAVPAWFELYVSMEAAANHLRHFSPALIPGLLQTREYAAAVLRARRDTTEDEVAQAVAVRLERQTLLARRLPVAPLLEVILDESVLRRPIPDRQGMRGQLDYLGSLVSHPRISVRVLPLRAGVNSASVASAFVILDFPAANGRLSEPTTVYSESLTGALYLDRPGEVQAYAQAWESLGAQALTRKQTGEFIAELARESHDA